MGRNIVTIEDEIIITLGQLLKLLEIIQSGGEAKWFLRNHNVFVNNKKEKRRGRKLYDGDIININNKEYCISYGNK